MALAAAGAPVVFAASADLDEIVVSAQKRPERARDVPLALTVYDQAHLDALGAETFSELSRFVPGLQVQAVSPNTSSFVLRGLGANSTEAATEARVSIFQDGVPISKTQGANIELFDLDRVEVVKGPQSTLFGRGALIGAVNIIQRKASPERVEGYARLDFGNYAYRRQEGALNLPLTEHLALRLSGRTDARDGYVKNALDGSTLQGHDAQAGRIAVNFQPDRRLNADLIFNDQRYATDGAAYKSGPYYPTDPNTGAVLANRKPWTAAAVQVPANFEGGQLGLERSIQDGALLLDYTLSDALTLHSISAYRRFSVRDVYDVDGLSLPVVAGMIDAGHEQASQELRLGFDDGGRLRGFIGANYLFERGHQRLPFQFDERLGLALLTQQLSGAGAGTGLSADRPAPAAVFTSQSFNGALIKGAIAGASGGHLLLSDMQAQAIAANLRADHAEEGTSRNRLRSFDVFADLTFDIASDLDISAGLRYTHDERVVEFGSRTLGGRSVLGGMLAAAQLAARGDTVLAQQLLNALASPAVQQLPDSVLPNFGISFSPTAGNGRFSERTQSDDALTWRLVSRYALNETANLYASYARGRRPPLLATSGPAAPGAEPVFNAVAPEIVDSYEIGFKGLSPGRRLRFDASVYAYEYSDFQTVEQRGTLFYTTNAGRARASGAELQAQWDVDSHLSLFGTFAYNHARFVSGAYEGNRFRLAPDQTLSLAASWRTAVPGGELSIWPSYTWQSRIFFSDNNDRPELQQPPATLVADTVQDEYQNAYALLNLRAFLSFNAMPLTLEAFVTNLTDRHYLIDAGRTGDGFGLPIFVAGPPRMWGGGASYRF